MKYTIVFFFGLSILNVNAGNRKLPDFVNVCKRSDPNLSACVKGTIQSLQSHLIKGIPEMQLPTIEPFFVEKVSMNMTGSSTMNFILNLFNATFHGTGNYFIVDAKVNLDKLTINLDVKFPEVKIKSYYKARGKIMVFEFDGDGDLNAVLKEPMGNMTWYLDLKKKNGDDYLHIIKGDLVVTVNNVQLHLDNLFRGNPEISENINKVINENIDILYKDFHPLFSFTIRTVLTSYADKVFDLFTLDTLLPKD